MGALLAILLSINIITTKENMRKKPSFHSLAVLVALLISAAGVRAHNGMEHVMGTVSKLSESSVTVETVQHKTVVVLLEPSTKFSHNEAASSLQDLHVGDRVVIHAKPSPEKKLVGVTVKWGAGSAAHTDHIGRK